MLDLALPLADLLPTSPGPYIALMLIGFAVGILGHLSGAKSLVAAGIVLIFLGALLFPLLVNVTSDDRPPPIEEVAPVTSNKASIALSFYDPGPDLSSIRRSQPLSRLRIFALLAALTVLATAFVACGSSSDSSDENPEQVLDSASLEGVKSGNLDLSLAIEAEGDEGGDIDVSVSGPFQSKGSDDLPELDLSATANGTVEGDPLDFEGGITVLSDRAYVNYEGTEYEVDPTTYGFVKSGFEQAQKEGGSEGNPADIGACQEAAEGFKVGDFAERLTNEGSADVDGTSTTKISGELNVGGAIDAIIKLTEDPACSTQLEAAGPLPIGELEEAKGELTSSVKKAQVEVYVGDDNIIRRIVADLTVEPEGTSDEKVEVDLDMVLSGVNEEQEITAPSGAKPLEDLFQELGINPIKLLESFSSGEGIGDLLEEVIGDDSPLDSLPGGDGSSGGSGSDGGSGGGGGQQAYLDCLKDARTPADLQQCASMIQ